MRNILLYLFLLVMIPNAFGQYYQKHHIAPAPWQYWSTANEIVIGTLSKNNVEVELTKSDGAFITNLTVTAGEPVAYVFEGLAVNATANAVGITYADRGIIVNASEPVMVSVRNIASDLPGTGTGNIKGNAALASFGDEGRGVEFRLGYYRSSVAGLNKSNPVYSVMATLDETTVVLPTTPNTTTIVLERGESRLFYAPIGSKLTSDKPVVMNVGSWGDTPMTCGAGTGEDGTFDQIAPVNVLGKQYLVVRGNGTAPRSTTEQNNLYGPEQSLIVASEDNTVITLQNFNNQGVPLGGAVSVTLATGGAFHSFYHGDGQNQYSSTLVDSNKPVIVFSGTAVTCETDISTVLPIGGCSGTNHIETTKFVDINGGILPYFGFVVIESATEPIMIGNDNLEILTNTNRVPLGNSGFYMLRFTNAQIGNPNNIILYSGLPLTISLVQQGDGFSMSAFFSAFGKSLSLGDDLIIDGVNALCPGESHLIDSKLSSKDYSFQWTKDGIDIVGANGSSYLVTETGLYDLVLANKGAAECLQQPSPIKIEFFDDIIFEKEIADYVQCTGVRQDLKYNLLDAIAGITFNDVAYSFHENEDDANAGVNPIGDANYMYELGANFTTKEIWVRFQNIKDGVLYPCYRVKHFNIVKEVCEVELVPLNDLEICGDPTALGSFDLSVYTDIVYHGISGYDVTYHLNQVDASGIVAGPAIDADDLEDFQGVHNQVIWVRVTKATDATVYKFTSFTLRIRREPVIHPNLTPLYACVADTANDMGVFYLKDKDSEIKQSASGLIVEYYSTEQGAIDGDALMRLPSTLPYTSGESTVYIRLYSVVSGCFSVGELELKLAATPVLNPIDSYSVCDPSGYHSFMLDLIAQDVIGVTALLDNNYSFYRTYVNAEQKTNPLKGTSYTNVVPWAEVIYIRVENKQSKCFVIQSINLRVVKPPVLVAPSDFVICDLNGSGISFFDLTEKESEILGDLDAGQYDVSYYTSMAFAQNKNPQGLIATPESYSNLTSTYVYIRVEDPVSGCFSVVALKLVVKSLPTIPGTLTDYVLCDGSDSDGKGDFALSTKKLEILGVTTTLDVTFHVSLLDAESGVDALSETSYENTTAYMQTIYVRISSKDTGCFIVRPMNLIVNAYPSFDLGDKGEVHVCTDSNNEVGIFNLVEVAQNNIPNVNQYTFGFYESLDHATQNINRIVDAEGYTNVGVSVSSVWIRIVHNTTGCVGIYEVVLKVSRAPHIPAAIPSLVVCDNFGGYFDSMAEIDLTVNQAIILSKFAGVSTLDYFNTEEDAEANIQAINTPEAYRNTDAEEIIWFRVTDVATGCFTVGSFSLKVNIGLVLVQPEDLSVCSDLQLGQNKYSFDLTIREDAIVGGLPVFGTNFKYYETEAEAKARVNAITNIQAYMNKTPVQNIWVVVENELGCFSTTTLTLRVFATPEPNLTPASLEKCEDIATPGETEFNLEDSIADIINGDNNLDLTYFETQDDARNGVNAIATPEAYVSRSRVIYVRVENRLADITPRCYVVVPLRLVVNSLPEIGVLTPLLSCLEDHPDFYEFNLQDKDADILKGRNSADYIIKYFIDENSALDNVGALPYTYTNITPLTQDIWVRLENKATGCFSVAELTIQIEERIFAFDIEDPAPFCDDNDAPGNAVNDGSTRIDLTQYSLDIIGDQAVGADELTVVYFASMTDYQNGIAIANPAAYENEGKTQTIVAVVRNRDADLFCEDYITFEITVNVLPEVLPLEDGYLCTDLVTGTVSTLVIDSKLDSNLYEFVWLYNGAVMPEAKLSYYEANRPGTYTVRTIDKLTGCASFNSADAVVTAIDLFTIIIEEDLGGRDQISDTGSQTIVVRVEEKEGKFPAGAYEYALNDGGYQDSNVFRDVEAGDHLVWVRDKVTGACVVSKVVSVMNYPKYFTPNGDGFNDTWNVLGLKSQPNAKVYIFDRSGKLLIQLSPLGDGWDGTYGGRPMPSTDYWFTVEYVDFNGYGREFKGHFSLKR